LIPASLQDDAAAALPTAGMTALSSLDALSLPKGATLVITGASGGVGSLTTEFAAAQGLRVIAVARAASADRLRSLGAAEVIDLPPPDAAREIAEAHAPGVDGLLDLMSDRVGFDRWSTVVRPGGTAVTTTFSADEQSLKEHELRGGNINLQPSSILLDRLARMVAEHRLPIPIERRVPLREAPAALADIRAGRASGKTVIIVGH